MISQDKTSKKSNLNNKNLTGFPDQEQYSTSINQNNISLINASLSSKNRNIDIDIPKEKELLLSQVKSKNRFNTTSRFAVLTNIRLCIYYSKDNYLKDKQNPYKVFILNEYKFEIEKKLLIIKRISNNKNKYITVKKYEFNTLEVAIKWWETIIASITLFDLKYNQYLKEYYNKKIYEELSENNSNNLSIYNQNELQSNMTNEFIGNVLKDKNGNKNNQNFNVDENRKTFEINDNINVENDKSQREEKEEAHKEQSQLKISKEEGNNKDEIENVDYAENISVNKSIINNGTYSSIYSKLYCNEDVEDNESNNDLKIKNKPSFRFLLKEVINKVENELENNITNDNIDNSIDNHINKNKNIDNLKDDELGKKYSYILSSVNNNNKNIYSFGKRANLNSFNSKNVLKKKEKPIDIDKFKIEISGNDIEIKELSESKTNEYESEKTNDNISPKNICDKIKNKKNSKKNSSKNLEINTNSNSKNNSRRNFDIIKLKSCEKDNTTNSELNFDLSNSDKNCKKSEKSNSSNNLNQKGDFLENNEQKNKIRSFILNNSNENQNLDKKDEKNDNISFDSKSNISCFCDNLNSSKNIDKILNTMKETKNDLDKTSNKSVSQTYKNYLKKIEEENANYLKDNNYRSDDDDSNSQRTILYSENTNKTNNIENNQNDKKSILDKTDDPFKSINNIKMFDSQSQSKEDNSNISKINFNSGDNSINSIKTENIKNPAEIDVSSLYNTNINQNSSFLEANPNISVQKNSEKEECSYAFSNDIYTDIHEQEKYKSKGRVDDNHSNKNNNNDNNSILNDKSLNISLNSKNDNDNNGDISHSILLIDKNSPLLINSSKYENNTNKEIDRNKLLNKSSNINNENKTNIHKEFDNKDNFNELHKKNKPPKCKHNSVNLHKMNKNDNYSDAIVDNQVNFNDIGGHNERRTAEDNNNNILKNIISKNHFEFNYSPNNLKNRNNNSFLSVKNKNSFNFQVQNAIYFNIDSIKKETKNNYYHFEISKESFPINTKHKNEDNAIKKSKNISDKNKNYKCKNKSLDMINQYNYDNGFNEIKTHKHFLCKNMLKKDLLKDCENMLKIENCENKNDFEIKSISDDFVEFSSDEEFITKSGRKIDDLSQRINHRNRNDKLNNKQYNNKLLMCNLINNTFSENMSKYPDHIKNDKYIISNESYKEVNNNNEDKNKSKNSSSRYISTIENNNDKNSTESYTFIEKSFKLVEKNEMGKNEEGKITPSKLIENILIHRYSKQMLLYCYNNGMSTTTFIPKLEENLSKILKNNEKSDITLKYLFQNIPDIIRKRLQKDDLKLIFRPDKSESYLSNFGDDYKSCNDYIGVDDEYNKSKDGIKKLILNDNKLLVNILNKYFDSINISYNKNELYKYKKIFIQKMKNLNSEILVL